MSEQQPAGNRFAAADDFKETVRAQTDLVGLVGEKVRLQSRGGGRDYIGLCPFHDDSKPSFHVYPERNSYRCWACNEGGDCFEWVMKTERLEFREALELLARRAGLEMPQYGRRSGPSGAKRDQVLAACDWAAKQFAAALPKHEGASGYIASRGFSPEIIEAFRIGFHPDDWTWLIDRGRSRNLPIEVLAEAKLINRSQRTGDWLDYFVGRVVFPIRNERGQTIAFGGRVLPGEDERGPKYFNTPETPYFSKSRTLFGMDVARRNLEAVPKGQTRRAIVVEGYTDCITLHQYGLGGAVGVLGTALTEQHGRLLARFADQVVLVFDGDAAGQNAAARSVGTMLASDLDVRVLILPDGLDPDEFLKDRGVEALESLLDSATELWDWRIRRAVGTHGVDTVIKRERAANELLDTLHQAGLKTGGMRTEGLLRALERPLSISLATLTAQLQMREQRGNRNAAFREERIEREQRPGRPSRSQIDAARIMDGKASSDDAIEVELLEGLLHAPEDFAPDRLPIDHEDFTNVALGRLYRAADALARQSQPPSYENMLAILTVSELKRLLVFLDDQQRARLEDSGDAAAADSSRSGDGLPACLGRPLKRMLRRREEWSHREISRELPGEGTAAAKMSESEEALRRIQEFHARRAQKDDEPAGTESGLSLADASSNAAARSGPPRGTLGQPSPDSDRPERDTMPSPDGGGDAFGNDGAPHDGDAF